MSSDNYSSDSSYVSSVVSSDSLSSDYSSDRSSMGSNSVNSVMNLSSSPRLSLPSSLVTRL